MRYVVPLCAGATFSEWLVGPAAASSGANDRQSGQEWLDAGEAGGVSPDALRCEYPCITAPV
jgi:hypothetical protein